MENAATQVLPEMCSVFAQVFEDRLLNDLIDPADAGDNLFAPDDRRGV